VRRRFMCLTHSIMLTKVYKHTTGDHGEVNKVPTVTEGVCNQAVSLPVALCAVNFVHFR